MRGGKMPQSSSSEGPSLEDLAKSGIKVDVLQRLMPADRDEEGDGSLRKFIALDQVTMKGEDLTGRFVTCCHHDIVLIASYLISS